jgi:hypothetical protein
VYIKDDHFTIAKFKFIALYPNLWATTTKTSTTTTTFYFVDGKIHTHIFFYFIVQKQEIPRFQPQIL